MNNHVTIKDIARELGISTSTVSRALSDAWDVKRETREKVLEMAKKLHYRPNLNAKNLQNKHTGIIGIIIPEFVNSFFPNVVMGIQEELAKERYQMIITQSNECRAQERENLKVLEDYMVDGIIMSVTNEGGNEEHYREVMERGTPMVFFNRCPSKLKVTRVLIDDADMAAKAVKHLVDEGCRSIIHLTGPADLAISAQRADGYAATVTEAGMEPRVFPGGIFINDGYEAMKEVLASGEEFDAVFAFNDPVAIGAMKALKEAGKRIPDDVAIVGFSEGSMAKIVEPQLTSVLQPMKEMGREAARLLLEKIKATRAVAPKTSTLDATLNVRGSSKK